MKVNVNVLKNINGQMVSCVEEREYPDEEIIDNRTYKEKIIDEIRKRYSIDDELAILRQRDTKPEEFAEYNAFVESIKENCR